MRTRCSARWTISLIKSCSLDTPQAAFSGSAAGTSAAADDDDASDDSDDESSSESDSESDSDLDDDSGSDTETEAITPPSSSASSRPGLDPKDLLARALAAARSKAASQQTTADDDEQEVDELQMDVMQIGGSGEDGGTTTKKERPIPGLSVTLPAHYRKLDLRQQDEKKERKGKQPVVISPEQDSSSSREHEVDDAVYKKPLSRKDKLKVSKGRGFSGSGRKRMEELNEADTFSLFVIVADTPLTIHLGAMGFVTCPTCLSFTANETRLSSASTRQFARSQTIHEG